MKRFILEEAHMIMESEKSHNLLSASWRTNGLIQFESEEPRTSTHGGGQDDMLLPAQREHTHLLLAYFLMLALNMLKKARGHCEGRLLSQSNLSNAGLSWKPRNDVPSAVFPASSPVRLTQKITHDTFQIGIKSRKL